MRVPSGARLVVLAPVAVCALGAETSAMADTVTAHLPLAGSTFQYAQDYVTMHVDLGVQFSSIESITVQIVGQGHDGHYRTYPRDPGAISIIWSVGDPPTPPPPVDPPIEYTFEPSLSIEFDDPEILALATLANYQPGSPATWRATFEPDPLFPNQTPFHFLYDGEATVYLATGVQFWSFDGPGLDFYDPWQVQISDATMTVTGTVVPEPSAILLALAGAAIAARYRAPRSLRRKLAG
jgi:hypothetical protein